MRRAGVVHWALALSSAVACASSGDEAPYASNDCHVDCAKGIGVPAGSVTTPAASGGSTSATDAGVASGGFSGCTTDPATQVTLCLGASACPTVQVDPGQFPSCGFELGAETLSLECICAGVMLCPIGIGTSCRDLANLLAVHTLADVCDQVVTSGCRDLSALGTGGATGSGATTSCDPDCVSRCANSPSCIMACGC